MCAVSKVRTVELTSLPSLADRLTAKVNGVSCKFNGEEYTLATPSLAGLKAALWDRILTHEDHPQVVWYPVPIRIPLHHVRRYLGVQMARDILDTIRPIRSMSIRRLGSRGRVLDSR